MEKSDVVAELVSEQIGLVRGCITKLREASTECVDAFEEERVSYSQLNEANTELDNVMAAAVVSADYESRVAKEGPLNGLAKTSEAYKMAVKLIQSEACEDEAQDEYGKVRASEARHMQAQIDLQWAKSRLAAVKIECEMQTAILNALSQS